MYISGLKAINVEIFLEEQPIWLLFFSTKALIVTS